MNREQGRLTWAFIAEHWSKLVDLFASSHMVRIMEGIVVLDSEADERMVSAFFAEHDVPSGDQTLQQLLEQQRVAVALRNREALGLSRFLLG